jgi:hypothetical protein
MASNAQLNGLDQYLKNLGPLPEKVSKNMIEIRRLDGLCQVSFLDMLNNFFV